MQEGRGWDGRVGATGKGSGREGGAGGRRGAVVVWGGKGAGGRWREGKEDAKENNKILQKNKSTMLDDLGAQK